MYASPIVLIFSRPWLSTIRSNCEKRSSRARTSSAGESSAATRVKPTKSVKRTVADSIETG